jgi:hypothetical protein
LSIFYLIGTENLIQRKFREKLKQRYRGVPHRWDTRGGPF